MHYSPQKVSSFHWSVLTGRLKLKAESPIALRMPLTHAEKGTRRNLKSFPVLFSQTSPGFAAGGTYWEECDWKENTKSKGKGLLRWQQGCHLSSELANPRQPDSNAPHLWASNKATAGDWCWCYRGLSDGQAPATLFSTSLKQFRNQFQIWQAVSTLLLLDDGSDMLTAIRLSCTHVGARSAYSLLEEPKMRYYNHLTWGHGHMLCDLCLCHSPLSEIPSIVHRD